MDTEIQSDLDREIECLDKLNTLIANDKALTVKQKRKLREGTYALSESIYQNKLEPTDGEKGTTEIRLCTMVPPNLKEALVESSPALPVVQAKLPEVQPPKTPKPQNRIPGMRGPGTLEDRVKKALGRKILSKEEALTDILGYEGFTAAQKDNVALISSRTNQSAWGAFNKKPAETDERRLILVKVALVVLGTSIGDDCLETTAGAKREGTLGLEHTLLTNKWEDVIDRAKEHLALGEDGLKHRLS